MAWNKKLGVLESKRLMIKIPIHECLGNWNRNTVKYRFHKIYQKNKVVGAIEHFMPFALDIHVKDHNDDTFMDWISVEINDILTKSALDSMMISDHKMLLESSNWFMFLQCANSFEFSKRYGITKNMWDCMDNLRKPYFYDEDYASLLDLYYYNSTNMFIVDIGLESDNYDMIRVDDRWNIPGSHDSPKRVALNSSSIPEAIDLCKTWGVPVLTGNMSRINAGYL